DVAAFDSTVAVAAAGNLDDAVERPEDPDDDVQVDIDAGLNTLRTHDQTRRTVLLKLLDSPDRLEPVGRRDISRQEFSGEAELRRVGCQVITDGAGAAARVERQHHALAGPFPGQPAATLLDERR